MPQGKAASSSTVGALELHPLHTDKARKMGRKKKNIREKSEGRKQKREEKNKLQNVSKTQGGQCKTCHFLHFVSAGIIVKCNRAPKWPSHADWSDQRRICIFSAFSSSISYNHLGTWSLNLRIWKHKELCRHRHSQIQLHPITFVYSRD